MRWNPAETKVTESKAYRMNGEEAREALPNEQRPPLGPRETVNEGSGRTALAYDDLRDWIKTLEKNGELKRIREEVSPELEITEITDRVSKIGSHDLLPP